VSTPALEIQDLHKSFGKTEVIRGASLSVVAGERLALIGPNGAGKSTLFNLISGRLPATKGQVLLQGQPISGLAPQQIQRLGLARSFQITNLFLTLSVFENIRCSVLWQMGYRYNLFLFLSRLTAVNQRADEWVQRLGLQARRDVPAGQLTYAEQRALELGVTCASGAPVVLLDEPTAGMSRAETEYFIPLIREITQGKTLLVVEHDMDVVFGLADRVAVLVRGEVIACDVPEVVRANPKVQESYLGSALGASLQK
jgi:branched-chain amino acid transport system ATP-binding protein